MISNRIEFILPPKDDTPSLSSLGMKPLHPDLPQLPFFVGVIGPRFSGKSVWVFNMLSPLPGMYGEAFKKDNIIFYSPTKDKDKTMKKLKLKHMYGPPTALSWLIDDIRNKQQAHMEADNMAAVLLVIDDATKLKNAWPAIEELGYTGRHDHIHCFFVAHKISAVPRGVRTQTQQWILFEPHEESEKTWVYETYAPREFIPIFRHAFMRAWSIEHNFVYVDYVVKDRSKIYRSGFHDPLFTPEELSIVTGHDFNEEQKEEEIESSEEDS